MTAWPKCHTDYANDAPATGWAKRPNRSTPRPIVEQFPRIDIADLCRFQVFPDQRNWRARHILELPFRYPFLKSLIISLQTIEANHISGYTQSIPLRWCRSGFGGNYRPRPLFICTNCGRSITKLYFKGGSLNCRRSWRFSPQPEPAPFQTAAPYSGSSQGLG
jgi:hypothetical protein